MKAALLLVLLLSSTSKRRDLERERESFRERKMAGNEWVNSYLEAILDVGGQGIDASGIKTTSSDAPSLLLRERGHFSPSRYFVEEVITGFDETDLHRSWVRVCSFLSLQLFFNSAYIQL